MADCVVCQRPILDTAYVCRSDADRLARQLHDAADLWPELDTTIARLARLGDPTPRAGRPAPAEAIRPDGGLLRHYADQVNGWGGGLVVDLAASDARDAIRNAITTWVRHIEGERGISWEPQLTPPGPEGPLCPDALRRWPVRWCSHDSCGSVRRMLAPLGLDAVLQWLATQLDWLRYRPQAGEAWDELGYACAVVARTVDRPVQRVDMGECGHEGEAGACRHRLSAYPGAAVVRCGGCGAMHEVAARRVWLLGKARDRRATATECARWLTWLGVETTPAMVRGLAHRGRIIADTWGRYRLGDVEACRMEQIEREDAAA